MTKDKVAAYVDNAVQNEADRRIKPIMNAIEAELASKRANDDERKRLDKEDKECDERITALQKELAEAKKVVSDLADKLDEAVDGAND